MTSAPFVDGVTAALVGVHDVDIHLGFWRDELGYEVIDSGVTNFGREAIKEMNRVGIVVDMSHSAEKSTFDAIELSENQ